MGLGGGRKRTKIAHDPNNTNWTRSTTGYGHKMLLSKGWVPGQNLGAVDAKHAHLHTEANSSHIRVTLREDNLGLGAKKGSGLAAGECTGLDAFQGLLGRLNGKSDDQLEKEQKSRDDLKRALYTERKWGLINFVKGETLVGDHMQKIIELERQRIAGLTSKELSLEPAAGLVEKSTQKSKKRKPRDEAEKIIDTITQSSEDIFSSGAAGDSRMTPTRSDSSNDSEAMTRAQQKAERVQRKLERAERRAMKAARRSARVAPENTSPVAPLEFATSEILEGQSTSMVTAEQTVVIAPRVTASGRHNVRQRYIQQKRLAVMDPRALKEIFMVKT